MESFKQLKKVELNIYDLIKKYESTGTKKELIEDLKKLDKSILKDMRGESNGNS